MLAQVFIRIMPLAIALASFFFVASCRSLPLPAANSRLAPTPAVTQSPAQSPTVAPSSPAAPSIQQPSSSPVKSDAEIWSVLRQGANVVMLRHAIAPGTGDPANFQLDDCSTQRNLSEAGRQQARRIGELFRQQNITVARVLSSQWCRCLETARLMDLAPVEPFPAINSFFNNRATEAQQTAEVKQLIVENRSTGVILLVTHQVNITAVTGVVPQSGEAVVLRAPEKQLEVVGSLPLN